jgi:hypothetical protein
MDRVSRRHPALFACSPRKCVTRLLRFDVPEYAKFTLLAGAHRPVRSPCVNRFACNRATANPRRLQAQNSTIVLSKFARLALFETRKLKYANSHPLTVVDLSSEPWFAATAAGQSERRSSITPGTSLNTGGAQVAQLVEHVTENHGVGGSIPPLGTIILSKDIRKAPRSMDCR